MNQIDEMLELARFQRLRVRLERKEYKERNHGITKESIKYLARHINLIGMIVCVEGKRPEKTQEDYWTTFTDKDGNKIVCSGFAWGYYGEGPSGLQKTLSALGWDYSTLDVANFPDSFKITG